MLEDRVRDADLLVRDGGIAAIVGPGEARAEETVEARRLTVFPGVVDAHVHVNDPGRTEWEGWAAATRGAAAGGVTTVLDMPLNSIPPTVDAPAFDAKERAAAREAVVDFALWGGVVRDDPDGMERLHARGVVGFEAFLCDSGVAEFPPVDDATVARALGTARRLGAVVGVHAEDASCLARHRGPRPEECEIAAVERVVELAARARAGAHVPHVSSAGALARVRGGVTAETCPHYLLFSEADLAAHGALLKCAPPLRDAANRERLWRAVLAGEVEVIASDHSPCPPELKRRELREAWGGVTGIQSLLPALLTEGVHRRGLALERLARLVATNPARRFGLSPRKGAIRVGADADLVLVDLGRRWTFERVQLFAPSGLSPYLGREFRGAVVRTIVRGETVYVEGKITAEPGYGRFIAATRPRPS